jgi:hypothetical protein
MTGAHSMMYSPPCRALSRSEEDSAEEMDICERPCDLIREGSELPDRRGEVVEGHETRVRALTWYEADALEGCYRRRKVKEQSFFFRALERKFRDGTSEWGEQWVMKFVQMKCGNGSESCLPVGGRLLWAWTAGGETWWSESGERVGYDKSGASDVGVDEDGRVLY